jgi:glycosyltransferase involved in cell wall biosynthesis
MNILLLNHYAGTPALGMEFRPYYLAREWVRAGHRVQILAASYSHVRACQPTPGEASLEGVAYRWYATPRYQGNGLGRVRNIWAFVRAVWADTPRLVREFQPDAVIASSTYPMDIWVARRIARLASRHRASGGRTKLVYEVHDLWPLSPIELTGMSPRHPFALLCQKAEDDAYRDADIVVSMLPKVHQHMAAHGLNLAKLHIVPNGIALDDWKIAPQPLREDLVRALAEARGRGCLIIGYAGSMGLPNALDTLLDAAQALRGVALHFVLVGDGHEKARLAQRLADEQVPNVSLFEPIPKTMIPSFLAAIDIAYIGWQRVPIYRFGIAPNKLMDYMMAAVPVLHGVEAGNDPVAEAGCGVTVGPESPEAVVQGLRRLAALSAEQRRAMGQRGRDYVCQHHSYAVLARRFIGALEAPA